MQARAAFQSGAIGGILLALMEGLNIAMQVTNELPDADDEDADADADAPMLMLLVASHTRVIKLLLRA
jgi:hypothetical protein